MAAGVHRIRLVRILQQPDVAMFVVAAASSSVINDHILHGRCQLPRQVI
jgi:hypothetical protein